MLTLMTMTVDVRIIHNIHHNEVGMMWQESQSH